VSQDCFNYGFNLIPILKDFTTCDTLRGLQTVFSAPDRRPDYYVYDAGFSGVIASGGIQIVVTHDRSVFVGFRSGVGLSTPGPSGQFSFGYVGSSQGSPPDDKTIDNMVNGWTIDAAAGINIGPLHAGLTLVWSPTQGIGGEEYSPGGVGTGVTAGKTCSIQLPPGDPITDALAIFGPSDIGPWPFDGGPIPQPPGIDLRNAISSAGGFLACLASPVGA
jgi:hypothetical protein